MTQSTLRLPSFNDFSPKILDDDIRGCLQAIVDSAGDDSKVFDIWAKTYFGGKKNKRSTTNIPATLSSTGLTTGSRPLALSDAGTDVLSAPTPQEASRRFCRHLLCEKNARVLIEALSALTLRKEKVTKASLKSELQKLGVSGLSPGTTDHTTLKNWMIHAGLVDKNGAPVDSEIKSLLGIGSDEISEFHGLTLGQQVFLNLLRRNHESSTGPFQVTELLRECMSRYPHLFDEAQFAKKVRRPLEDAGWIEAEGLATGVHGGRSGRVVGTTKLRSIPISQILPDFDQVIPSDLRSKLNTPLDDVFSDLIGVDKHKAGLALELLALRMIMDLGLQPRGFRVRSAETAFAEVDLVAEGAHLLFSRWTFQCKRYAPGSKSRVGLGDVAKEVGIAIFAKAHVVVMVTTTDFTQQARNYAAEVAKATHLQFVFVDGTAVEQYLSVGRGFLWEFFLENAEDVMVAKREQALPSSE